VINVGDLLQVKFTRLVSNAIQSNSSSVSMIQFISYVYESYSCMLRLFATSSTEFVTGNINEEQRATAPGT
jgi:hypothetical protein